MSGTKDQNPEAPSYEGLVPEEPVRVGAFYLRAREGELGIEYCLATLGGTPDEEWHPFVPSAQVNRTRVADGILEAMRVAVARVLACPSAAGAATRELAELGGAYRAISYLD